MAAVIFGGLFRAPRARRAQHTEVWLGVLFGSRLVGLGILIHRFSLVPHAARHRALTALARRRLPCPDRYMAN